MSVAAIFCTVLAVLAGLSAWAARRFAGYPRLPMNWGPDRRPGWQAPRWVALAFTPVLGACLMGAVALAPARDGGTGQTEVLLIIGAALVAGHAYHLRRLVRWDRDEGGRPPAP